MCKKAAVQVFVRWNLKRVWFFPLWTLIWSPPVFTWLKKKINETFSWLVQAPFTMAKGFPESDQINTGAWGLIKGAVLETSTIKNLKRAEETSGSPRESIMRMKGKELCFVSKSPSPDLGFLLCSNKRDFQKSRVWPTTSGERDNSDLEKRL